MINISFRVFTELDAIRRVKYAACLSDITSLQGNTKAFSPARPLTRLLGHTLCMCSDPNMDRSRQSSKSNKLLVCWATQPNKLPVVAEQRVLGRRVRIHRPAPDMPSPHFAVNIQNKPGLTSSIWYPFTCKAMQPPSTSSTYTLSSHTYHTPMQNVEYVGKYGKNVQNKSTVFTVHGTIFESVTVTRDKYRQDFSRLFAVMTSLSSTVPILANSSHDDYYKAVA